MADARILKFDVGSPTDKMLNAVQLRLNASTGIETFRRSLAIADYAALRDEQGRRSRDGHIKDPGIGRLERTDREVSERAISDRLALRHLKVARQLVQ